MLGLMLMPVPKTSPGHISYTHPHQDKYTLEDTHWLEVSVIFNPPPLPCTHKQPPDEAEATQTYP